MAATDLLDLFPISCNKMSKKEKLMLETILFKYLYQELATQYASNTQKEENDMINSFVIKNLTNELLTMEEYSLEGLATYTGFPEEVISDLARGINLHPTFALSTKIIELHVIA